jgi:ERF superfamily
MKNISTALVKAQRQFAPALKNATNPHFRSKYVDLASCVDSVIGALNDNGIFLFQTTSEHPEGVICETSFLHESGERLDCGKLFFPAPKHDPQGFMSCLTYIRRASLMAATGQAPEDDDGNAASKKVVKETKANHSAMQDHLTAISESTTVEELQTRFKEAYKAAGTDKEWLEAVTAAKDLMKRTLK